MAEVKNYGGDLYEVCLTDYCPSCGAKMDGGIRSVAEECKAQGIETMTPEELAGLMDRRQAV